MACTSQDCEDVGLLASCQVPGPVWRPAVVGSDAPVLSISGLHLGQKCIGYPSCSLDVLPKAGAGTGQGFRVQSQAAGAGHPPLPLPHCVSLALVMELLWASVSPSARCIKTCPSVYSC